MLKKIMVLFMILCLLVRGGSLVYLLANVHTVLSNGVLGCTALVCAVFATLTFYHFFKSIQRRELEFAFILDSIIVIINMLMLRTGVPSTLNLFEYLATGTLFEVVVGIVFVVLSKQRTAMLVAQKGI